MGRLRTAACTLAETRLRPRPGAPALDRITSGLEHYIATCLYAVYDPHHARCHIANAGHMPPVLVRTARPPRTARTCTPRAAGCRRRHLNSSTIRSRSRDDLVPLHDGLIETRHHPIDDRL
ncbi:SpoIIE family protein phosphatase [Streptomyces yanii]|uniref:SpoIIE family protein phosphatase n=1 Tax=Streptomyces yanii TaxID=78510 RepID=UPI003384AAD3